MTAILIGPCCCKCCVNFRYRLWLIAHSGGLGGFRALEWEATQGSQTITGEDYYYNDGVYGYAGNFMFHNATDIDKSPFYETNPMAAMQVWIAQSSGYIDIQAQCNTIRWRPGNNSFCTKESGVTELFGEDSFTESVFIQTGTAADLPDTETWDSQATYKFGYTQWREIELCET